MQNFYYQLIDLIKQKPLLAYIFAIFNSFLQIFFPPYPGDTFIALQGYLSSQNILNSTLLLIITLSSTIISSIMLFLISFHFSDRVVNNKFVNRFFNLKKIYDFEKWYNNFGDFAIVLSKFIPGINSIVLIASGVLKLNKKTAIIAIILSSILHNSMLFFAGKITGNNLTALNVLIKEYNSLIILLTLLSIIIYVIFIMIKKFKE